MHKNSINSTEIVVHNNIASFMSPNRSRQTRRRHRWANYSLSRGSVSAALWTAFDFLLDVASGHPSRLHSTSQHGSSRCDFAFESDLPSSGLLTLRWKPGIMADFFGQLLEY